MKLSCIIVDDEPLALDILEAYAARTSSLELAGRFTSGSDALEVIRRGGIDLAFLDIQMPGLGGMEVAKMLRNSDTRVVFTTAFPQYALEGFRVEALDYLLKPIDFDEFSNAVGRAVEWFSARRNPRADEPRTLIVSSGYKQRVIALADVVRIEGVRDYVCIHTLDEAGRTGEIRTLMALKTVEAMLPVARFARVHRSHIVALGRVRRLERAHVVLDGETAPIPVSESYRAAFWAALSARALP